MQKALQRLCRRLYKGFADGSLEALQKGHHLQRLCRRLCRSLKALQRLCRRLCKMQSLCKGFAEGSADGSAKGSAMQWLCRRLCRRQPRYQPRYQPEENRRPEEKNHRSLVLKKTVVSTQRNPSLISFGIKNFAPQQASTPQFCPAFLQIFS